MKIKPNREYSYPEFSLILKLVQQRFVLMLVLYWPTSWTVRENGGQENGAVDQNGPRETKRCYNFQ